MADEMVGIRNSVVLNVVTTEHKETTGTYDVQSAAYRTEPDGSTIGYATQRHCQPGLTPSIAIDGQTWFSFPSLPF
jgi:hypothetical protein